MTDPAQNPNIDPTRIRKSVFLAMELKSKQICRFCLTTNRPLVNIYKSNNQDVPLSLQVIACVSIEVRLLLGVKFVGYAFVQLTTVLEANNVLQNDRH